jgi:hypothetical protein
MGRSQEGVRVVAYPEPIPVLKGKAAEELLEKLNHAEKHPRKDNKWAGSRKIYQKLRPKDEIR